jgi:hypothetical protein
MLLITGGIRNKYHYKLFIMNVYYDIMAIQQKTSPEITQVSAKKTERKNRA